MDLVTKVVVASRFEVGDLRKKRARNKGQSRERRRDEKKESSRDRGRGQRSAGTNVLGTGDEKRWGVDQLHPLSNRATSTESRRRKEDESTHEVEGSRNLVDMDRSRDPTSLRVLSRNLLTPVLLHTLPQTKHDVNTKVSSSSPPPFPPALVSAYRVRTYLLNPIRTSERPSLPNVRLSDLVTVVAASEQTSVARVERIVR